MKCVGVIFVVDQLAFMGNSLDYQITTSVFGHGREDRGRTVSMRSMTDTGLGRLYLNLKRGAGLEPRNTAVCKARETDSP